MKGPRHRLLERPGQGGMATVWRAEDRALGRDVAVKVLLPLFADRPAAQERFFREARALAMIPHPNVLQLFDFLAATKDEPARLVMERLAGPSLHRFGVDARQARVCAAGGRRCDPARGHLAVRRRRHDAARPHARRHRPFAVGARAARRVHRRAVRELRRFDHAHAHRLVERGRSHALPPRSGFRSGGRRGRLRYALTWKAAHGLLASS